MSTYLHGQATDRQTAQGAHVPAGVRPLPLLRPHREGGGGPFRDRRKKRLLLHGVAGAQGVHPSRPEIPPPDRVPRGGGASCPPARSGARADSRGGPPGGRRPPRVAASARPGEPSPPPPPPPMPPSTCRTSPRPSGSRGKSSAFSGNCRTQEPPCPVARPIRRSSFPPLRISSAPPPFACVPRRGISPASSGRAPPGWGGGRGGGARRGRR